MAVASDDGIPSETTATEDGVEPDGDTTAAATAPATLAPENDESDRTVEQPFDPGPTNAEHIAALAQALSSPSPPSPPRPSPFVKRAPKASTMIGLGAPSAAAPYPSAPLRPRPVAFKAPPPEEDEAAETAQTEANAEDGSITTAAPVRRSGSKSAVSPGELLGALDEALDETEVRTVVSGLTEEAASTSPLPGAGRPLEPLSSDDDEDDDDSVTTRTPSALRNVRLPDPTVGDDDKDAYDADESVTTRGPAVADFEDDNVTAQGPRPAPRAAIPLGARPTLPDEADAALKRAAERAHDFEEDIESVTTRAPGQLTNMLRVIATPEEPLEGDEPLDNKTAVMPGAPARASPSGDVGALQRARSIAAGSGGARGAALAELREPSSDSGLRLARGDAPSGDQAVMVVPGVPPLSIQTFNTRHGPLSPQELEFGAAVKRPRYGLLVVTVAIFSFAIPLALFLWLQQGMVEDAPPRVAAEVEPDRVPRGDPARPRATKAPPPPTSATTTSRGGRPRRR